MVDPNFPRLAELGVAVRVHPGGVKYVCRQELNAALGDRLEQFRRLYGVQTAMVEGPFAWDVESVLERMTSGKLVGSQKDWD